MMGSATSWSCTLGAAGAGHPLWHLAGVAVAACAVFAGIKTHEQWQRRRHPRTPSGAAPRQWPQRDAPVMIVATFSLAAAAVHANVTGEHFREAFTFGVFFLACACLQGACAIALVMHPSRKLLLCAIALNASVVCVWTLTRSIGVPIGPRPWHAEPIGTVDLVCGLIEIGIVIGAALILQRSHMQTSEPRQAMPDSVARLLADSRR